MKTILRFITPGKRPVFIASLFILWIASACAQGFNKEQESVVAKLTRYEVKPGYQQKFRTALSDYVVLSIASENNIMAEAYYEETNPNLVWLIERWTNSDELNRIQAGTSFKATETLTKKAVTKPSKSFYLKDLEPLSKQQWRKMAKKEDKSFTVMLFVDAKPGTQKTFIDAYNVAMPKFRSEAGVVTYQLSQLQEDNTQFVTYEKFRNEEAFQYHLSFCPIEPVIAYLQTSIKNQPFQSGLHRLIEFAPLTRE
jgi:quinol monooxygenase YgiN